MTYSKRQRINRELEKFYNSRVIFHRRENWDGKAHELAALDTRKKLEEEKEG